VHYARYVSPLGPLLLTCEDNGLTGIWFDREIEESESSHPILEQTKRWLDDYFAGNIPARTIPVQFYGTPFQKQVWQILMTIPFGKTRTYGDIAREMAHMMGKEKMSAQAVGQAVGKNPISILVPCHRVVGAGGKLTGYASGLEKKIWLLEHEDILL